jgi:hypothetical protein
MKEAPQAHTQTKEAWTTPELVVHGDAKKITLGGIPTKTYGSSDGATWNGQSVVWAGS